MPRVAGSCIVSSRPIAFALERSKLSVALSAAPWSTRAPANRQAECAGSNIRRPWDQPTSLVRPGAPSEEQRRSHRPLVAYMMFSRQTVDLNGAIPGGRTAYPRCQCRRACRNARPSNSRIDRAPPSGPNAPPTNALIYLCFALVHQSLKFERPIPTTFLQSL